jgi:4-hydroxybenzoate polyprenyltransferase
MKYLLFMRFLEKLREFAILIRIQQVGASVTPIIGALSVKGNALDIPTAFLLLIIAMIINIGGQVFNDLCDYNIDKQSTELKNRPLVKGTFSLFEAKIIILANLFLVLAIIFYFFLSIYAILTILIGFLFGTLYNLYSKKIPGADLFLSLSLSLFFLFGAIVVTDNFQGFQDISVTTLILFFLVFIHVFLMDALGGGLKDAENDRKSGAKTIAVTLGVRANKHLYIPISYKIIMLLFEFFTIILTAILYIIIHREYHIVQLIVIILLLIGIISTNMRMLSMKLFDRKRIKYINRNHELFGYILVPMILINSTGIIWFIFLIAFPLLWFIIFNFILYRDSWKNPKTF